MKKIISILITVFVMSVSVPGYAWNIDRDFNSGVLGTKAVNTPDGFDHTSAVIYDNTQSVDGQAGKSSIKQGQNGFGNWGGYIDFPTPLGKGEKVYFEIYVYFPGFFQIQSGNGSMKFVRFYAKKVDGSNGGSLDIQLSDDNYSGAEFRMLKELQYLWFEFGNKGAVTRDAWHRVNIEFGVDNVTRSQGGGSYVKFWLDGVLLTYEQNVQTITQPTDKVINFLLFTYYNNGSPIDQYMWLDNIKITNVRPSWWSTLDTGALPPPMPPVAD